MEGTNIGILNSYNFVKEYETTLLGKSITAKYFPISFVVGPFFIPLNQTVEKSGAKIFIIFF